jgi:hypothetical protein
MSNYDPNQITPQERESYGDEFLGVVAKQARAATSAQMYQLQQSMAHVDAELKREKKRRLNKTLDERIPGWREQNNREDFVNDLKSTRDPYSGRSMHDLLTEAYNSGDATRVENIFKAWVPDTQPAPTHTQRSQQYAQRSQQRGTHPSGKPWITQNDIQRFYQWVSEGRYEGREQEKDAAERDLFQALNEGRVI